MAEQNVTLAFKKKVWITVGIVALSFIILWILKTTFNVLLLLLAGALIALYFHGLANLISKYTKWKHGLSMALGIIITFLLLVGFFWFSGAHIQMQIEQLKETLPATIDNFKQQLNKTLLGREIMTTIGSEDSKQKLTNIFNTFFRSSFGVLGDLYVVIIIGLFFTATPSVYLNGFIQLFPKRSKNRAKEVITKTGFTLTKWLKGQLIAMLIVAVLTAIGLSIIGVPMALALALIAGVLNFIPNFGPLIAMIPAVLIGLTQGVPMAIIVASLYILVQVVESNFITPQIQKRMINLPPAIIIIAQLFMGVLTGGWGLVLATPIVAILIVVVQELYIKENTAAES